MCCLSCTGKTGVSGIRSQIGYVRESGGEIEPVTRDSNRYADAYGFRRWKNTGYHCGSE